MTTTGRGDKDDAAKDHILDCLIIGGGPAGLTAAVYLARYRRSVAVYSEGISRAAYIPKSHNYPGFPSGVSGPELLDLLTEQAKSYGVPVVPERITSLQKQDKVFRASAASGTITARTLLLATGLVDAAPEVKTLIRPSLMDWSVTAPSAMRLRRRTDALRLLAARARSARQNSCETIRKTSLSFGRGRGGRQP
jgi:glycine/D-amino acid oxidase-like deaminating enzyme